MRWLVLALMTGCANGALGLPEACCHEENGQLVCRDNACPELVRATECTTLADTDPSFCQVSITDDCQAVYLERTGSSSGKPFQTVYCF